MTTKQQTLQYLLCDRDARILMDSAMSKLSDGDRRVLTRASEQLVTDSLWYAGVEEADIPAAVIEQLTATVQFAFLHGSEWESWE